MKFPTMGDIASTSVITIDSNALVSRALDIMSAENHRNIIVVHDSIFKVLTVLDILDLQQNNKNLDVELYKLDLCTVPVVNKDINVLDSLEFLNEKTEYICVISNDKTLYGIVTHTDLTSNIDPNTLMDSYKLCDFIKDNRRVRWVLKDETTSNVLIDMTKESFDNVVIVEKMKPIGILTTKDIIRLIKEKKDLNKPISTYMLSPVETINEHSSIRAALEFVKIKHYKRILVTDDKGDLSGIITQKELISLSYSGWTRLMKEHQDELSEINNILRNKNKEYASLASKDTLTGLYNRYKFTELYLSSYKTMLQRENNMSLLFLDIDLFKKVNDDYGHNVGDDVLIQVSKKLLTLVRSIDIVCRWGGEEFIILVPTATLDSATTLAQKIRKSINELIIEKIGNISISIGVSQVIEGETMEKLIDRADKALYLAKNSGRNCVKTELDT